MVLTASFRLRVSAAVVATKWLRASLVIKDVGMNPAECWAFLSLPDLSLLFLHLPRGYCSSVEHIARFKKLKRWWVQFLPV